MAKSYVDARSADFVASVEARIRRYRIKACQQLTRHKRTHIIPNNQRKATETIRTDKNIVVLSTDKGNTIAIRADSDHTEKVTATQ